jgi:NADH:ubiquinone oxidoreductase subunit E
MLEVSPKIEKTLNGILNRYITNEGNVISLLQDTQSMFGYIPEEAVKWFSKKLDIPESHFFGVATFYAQFYLKPKGKNIITACCGTACHVKGSERLVNRIMMELGLKDEEDTTEDNEFTLEKVNCVGACGIAPVVIINKKVYGNVTTQKIIKEMKGIGKKR